MVEVFQDTAGGFEVVIAAGKGAEVGGATEAAHLFVGEAEEDFADAGNDEGTGTHGAGFLGDVKGALVESPIAQGVGGL